MSKSFSWFTKITGFIPQAIYLRRKTLYVNKEAQGRKIKEPAIIISNHTNLMDFAVYMFTFPNATICPLVAEITYDKNKVMKFLMKHWGAVRVDRDSYDFSFMSDLIEKLDNNNSIIIFPEGRIPQEGEGLLPFKPSFVYVAKEANVPIIPTYTTGRYGSGKTKVVIGEKIYVNDLYDPTLSQKENINKICLYFENYVRRLGEIANEENK